MSASDVRAFKSRWPASGLPDKAIWFKFSPTGDLIDYARLTADELDRSEGSGALVALSQDAWEFAVARGAASPRANPRGRTHNPLGEALLGGAFGYGAGYTVGMNVERSKLARKLRARRRSRSNPKGRNPRPENYIGDAIFSGPKRDLIRFKVYRIEAANGRPAWLLSGRRGAEYGLVLPPDGVEQPGQQLIPVKLSGSGGTPRALAGLDIRLGHTGLPESWYGKNPRRTRSRKGRNGGRARKRRPRMARARQNPRSPKAGALHQFQRWQDRSNARGSWKKLRAPARIPTHMAGLGELVAIEYRSNKYDGKPKVYRHRTKTPRPMLATDPEGRDVFVVGGHMKVTPDGLVN
jgi:hypothetical protein